MVGESLRTGDVVLFSNNTPTGFLLKTFVSSVWNHGGVAVRIRRDEDGTNTITTDYTGELYILETNTGARLDDIYGKKIVGAGYSRADWLFSKYNKISYRPLIDKFRTQHLADNTEEFYRLYHGSEFPNTTLPFIGAWLGIPLSEMTDRMFCSELMCKYYEFCLGKQYYDITGNDYEGDLKSIFGPSAPTSHNLYKPDTFLLADCPIFSSPYEVIYESHADLIYIILQPLVITLIVALIIYLTIIM